MGLLIQWTLMSTITAVCIIVIRGSLHNKVKATWIYGLWCLLMIRLICPNLPESPWSVLNQLPSPAKQESLVEDEKYEGITRNLEMAPHQNLATEKKDIGSEEQYVGQQENFLKTPRVGYQINLMTIGLCIWCIGSVVVLGYFSYLNYNFKKRVKKFKEIDEEPVVTLIQTCKQKIGIHGRIDFKYGTVPMIVGVIKPIIILPEGYELKELEGIVLHELTHFKYRDPWINGLKVLSLAIHWYNPVIWAALYLMVQDSELACDERVLKKLQDKKTYAEVLMKVSQEVNVSPYIGSYMGNNRKTLKRRLIAMGKMNKHGYIWTMVLVVGAVVVGGVCLTNRQSENQEVSSQQVGEKAGASLWQQMDTIQFTNNEQKVEVSPSGQFAYVLDQDPRAIVPLEKSKVYVVSGQANNGEDYMALCQRELIGSLGEDCKVTDRKMEWVKTGEQELFKMVVEGVKGDYKGIVFKKGTVVLTVDPTKEDGVNVEVAQSEVGKAFSLTKEEQALYDAYKVKNDITVLKDASPMACAKINVACRIDHNGEGYYNLTHTSMDKEYVMADVQGVGAPSQKIDWMSRGYGLLDEGKFLSTSSVEGTIHYTSLFNDTLREEEMTLVKLDGVWKTCIQY